VSVLVDTSWIDINSVQSVYPLHVLIFRPSRIFRRTIAFRDIKDVEVTQRRRLVILDADIIYVTDDTGRLLSKIKPGKLECGALNNAVSVCTDKFDNMIVSDSGNRRLVQFLALGSYMTTLLSWGPMSPRRDSCVLDESTTASTYGITMSADGFLMVVVSGGGFAEVRVYRP